MFFPAELGHRSGFNYPRMNPKTFLLPALAAAVAAGISSVPQRAIGQASSEDAALNALFQEVSAQQQTFAVNQAKIDEKLAVISENLRVARIYVGRGGGKAGGR